MNKLYELDPAEISLVKKGANKRKFLTWKSKQGAPVAKKKPVKKDAVDPAMAAAAKPALSDRAKAAIQAVVRILSPFKGEVTDADLDQALVEGGVLAAGGSAGDVEKLGKDQVNDPAAHPSVATNAEKEDDDEEDEEEDDDAEDVSKGMNAIKEIVDKYCNYAAMNAKKEFPQGGKQVADEKDKAKKSVMKADGTIDLEAVPAEIRPMVEAIYKGQADLVKKNDDLTKQLADERKERREKEFTAKADGFKHYTGDKKELAVKLMKLQDADKDLYADFVKQLESIDAEKETVHKQLTSEKGSSLSSGAVGDVEQKIDAAVKDIVQKSADKISPEQAYSQFIQTPAGQELYSQYKSGRKDGI